MLYKIMKTDITAEAYLTDDGINQAIRDGRQVDTYEGTFQDAAKYAFLRAAEHAERIYVDPRVSGNLREATGGSFITTNGTRVIYTAKEA